MKHATYICTFGRVGRKHDVLSLTTEVLEGDGEAQNLAEKVFRYVKPMLASNDINVTTDLSLNKGWITAGFQNAGEFEIERVGP